MKRAHWCRLAVSAAILGGSVLSAAGQGSGESRALFKRLDKNSDGSISIDEVPEAQQRLLQRLLRQGDQNGDGKLTMQEFERANTPDEFPKTPLNQEGGGRDEARQRFEMLDRNKDGKVTLDEVPEPLRDRLKPIFDRSGKKELDLEDLGRFGGGGRPGPDDIFKRLDTNLDGKVSKDELPAEVRQRLAPLFERIGKDEVTLEQFRSFGDQLRETMGRPEMGNPEEMFGRFDANSDGKLTVDEVPERARPLVQAIMRRAGKEANGSLTKGEFAKNLPQGRDGERPPAENRRPESERSAERGPAFLRALDLDRDGRLSKDELAKAAAKFEELDKNQDGHLDPAELIGGGAEIPSRDRDSGSRVEGGRDERARLPGADGAGRGRTAPLFQRLHQDGDVKISKDEAPEQFKERFGMLDANGDRIVSLDEFRAGAASLGEFFRSRSPNRPQADSEWEGQRGDPKK